MQATSRDYEPSRRSRSGLVGGDAAKVEQAAAAGRLLGGDYLAAGDGGSPENSRVQRLHEADRGGPHAGSCGVLPAVLLPLARAGEAGDEAICEALYVAAGFGQVIAARATLAGAEGGCQAGGGRRQRHGRRGPLLPERRHAAACTAAAAMALGNLLGLVCDPVPAWWRSALA